MTFSAVLSRALEAGVTQQSTLTDGRLSLHYDGLQAHFAALDLAFAARGVALGDVLALECVTSVPGALTLLYVLSRGFSALLLPPRDRTASQSPVPRFCRKRLTVRSGLLADAAEISLLHPETFLEISEVAEHEPAANLASRTTDHVFLRTSGSFGTPKLAVFTHGQLVANALHSLGRTRLASHDRIAIPVPLPHMYGLGAGFLPGFAVGASLRLIESANLLRYLEHERAYRPTIAFLTPTLCAMFSRQTSAQDHYRHIVVAGDKLKRELFEAAELRFGRVLNLYGTTEMGVIAVADAAVSEGPRSTTVGLALPGVELRLDAPELAAEAPEGAGVIACRHPHGFEGYVEGDGRPWTGEPPLRDGWYRTRDLGRVHDGGFLEVLGREDHSVNRDGRLVLLAEVERAMEGLPGVERAITVLGRETLRGRDILAYCSLRDGHGLDASRLRSACAGVLPAYAIPDQIVITSDILCCPMERWIGGRWQQRPLHMDDRPGHRTNKEVCDMNAKPIGIPTEASSPRPATVADILAELKRLIVDQLDARITAEMVTDDFPLLERGLGLDSIVLFEYWWPRTHRDSSTTPSLPPTPAAGSTAIAGETALEVPSNATHGT